MSEYPPEIYEHLQRVLDSSVNHDDREEERLMAICAEEKLTAWIHEEVEVELAGQIEFVKDPYPTYIITGKGDLALRRNQQEPAKQQVIKSATVNEGMLAMLQADPLLINLSAREWGEKMGCSKANIIQTPAWKTIQTARGLERVRALEQAKKAGGK